MVSGFTQCKIRCLCWLRALVAISINEENKVYTSGDFAQN